MTHATDSPPPLLNKGGGTDFDAWEISEDGEIERNFRLVTVLD